MTSGPARAGRAVQAVLAAALAWPAAAASPALAAPAWLPPADISAPAAAVSQPEVAMDGQGNAVAIWRQGGRAGSDAIIRSAMRPAGGAWQAPVDLSRPGPDEIQAVNPGPDLAMNARGDAVAVWHRYDGTSMVVQGAVRPSGGAWSAPVDISAAGIAGGESTLPHVAIDERGNAQAVWRRLDLVTLQLRVQSAERPAGGVWQAPVFLSAAGEQAFDPDIAMNPQGTAVAVWARSSPAPTDASQAAFRSAGGAWQPPEEITGTDGMVGADLKIDPAGNVVVTWTGFGVALFDTYAAARPAAGGWRTTRLGIGGFPRLALDARGNAVVAWTGPDGVVAAELPAGGDWQPGVVVGPGARPVSDPDVVIDAQGAAIAAWSASTGPRPEILVSRRVAGTWGGTVRLSADERSTAGPRLAVDPNGNGVAVWPDTAGGVISAAGLDGAVPELRSLVVPASGAAGRRLALSASPFDVWGLARPASWNFGDGATASGNAVVHTFAAVGSLTVSVSAVDLAGNAVAAASTIVIKPSVLNLRLTPGAFRARRPARVSFRLPAASRVRFVVERVTGGRRVGGRCVGLTPGSRRRPICDRYLRAGAFSRSLGSGGHRFRLPARVAGRVLRPGRHRLRATPSAAGLTGTTARANFRVTR